MAMMTEKDMVLHMQSISPDVYLRLDCNGAWWVHWAYVEIKNGGVLESPTTHSESPEEAIRGTFAQYTDLPSSKYIVVRATSDNRRAYRWNGVCFAEITED